ncbi:MAG TPA: hypothetical protein VGO00_03550, partial [Kofleriaceae bacterium]|nr:hypothetical protein [Kofleriaceae bacterium]
MGAAATAVIVVAAMAMPARADNCTGVTDGGDRYPICFDVGNRIVVTGGTVGVAAGIHIRHEIHFADEPDLVWKLEHAVAQGSYGGLGGRFSASIYEGRFLRHSHDGHIVLPFGTPRKIFLPFDVGVEAQAGQLDGKLGDPTATLGVVRAVMLFDITRSDDFRRRL